MAREIIDFHIHPFVDESSCLCAYTKDIGTDKRDIKAELAEAGIGRLCGSVITKVGDGFPRELNCNATAMKLWKNFGDSYIPGIQVNSAYIDESCREIDAAKERGVVMVGELVPYFYGWSYSDEGFAKILEHTKGKIELYSLHTIEIEAMVKIAKDFSYINFVFAHPGERSLIEQHIEAMKNHENIYLDLSGTGLFRYGMLEYLVNKVGSERILFGTDYPICNPAMYTHGVEYEKISEKAKENIFSANAKRLLNIK